MNFYDNIDKFGALDRADPTAAFGYVGVHVKVPITIEVPSTGTDTSEGTSEGGDTESITLVTEVQFHPSSIYDGTPACVKEKLHPVFRSFHDGEAKKDPEGMALGTCTSQPPSILLYSSVSRLTANPPLLLLLLLILPTFHHIYNIYCLYMPSTAPLAKRAYEAYYAFALATTPE